MARKNPSLPTQEYQIHICGDSKCLAPATNSFTEPSGRPESRAFALSCVLHNSFLFAYLFDVDGHENTTQVVCADSMCTLGSKYVTSSDISLSNVGNSDIVVSGLNKNTTSNIVWLVTTNNSVFLLPCQLPTCTMFDISSYNQIDSFTSSTFQPSNAVLEIDQSWTLFYGGQPNGDVTLFTCPDGVTNCNIAPKMGIYELRSGVPQSEGTAAVPAMKAAQISPKEILVTWIDSFASSQVLIFQKLVFTGTQCYPGRKPTPTFCQDCPRGTMDFCGNTTSFCQPCADNAFCREGPLSYGPNSQGSMVDCDPGYVRLPTAQIPCVPNTWNKFYDDPQCDPCNSFEFCSGGVEPSICRTNLGYRRNESDIHCTQCPSNAHCIDESFSCNVGYYSKSNVSLDLCPQCPESFVCEGGTAAPKCHPGQVVCPSSLNPQFGECRQTCDPEVIQPVLDEVGILVTASLAFVAFVASVFKVDIHKYQLKKHS